MNLKNKNILALMLTIVIFASILNFEYTSLNYNNINKQDVNNYDGYYFNRDMINVLEEKAKNENNLQVNKLSSKIISNYFNKYIAGNLYLINNIFKIKYTADVNELFDIYCNSVFVVSYIHKKDGKKDSSG